MTSPSSPLVSVIIPCYNAAKYLAATVQSLRAQSMSDWECVLADDGSTDGTAQLIQRLTQEDPRMRGAHHPNAGRGEACNLGVRNASPASSYLFFLDSDDLLVPDALKIMMTYLEEHPRVGLVGCQFQEIDTQAKPIVGGGSRSRVAPGRFLPRFLSDDERETPFATFFCSTGQGPFAMYRRSVYAQTKGFDISLSKLAHEDTDIFCQMALKAPIHYLSDRLYLKRIHEGQVTLQNDRIQAAYVVFRQKWDTLVGATPEENRLLAEARRYYYRSHEPCRSLKVAAISIGEFFKRPRWKSLQWTATLLGAAFAGFSGLGSAARRYS